MSKNLANLFTLCTTDHVLYEYGNGFALICR